MATLAEAIKTSGYEAAYTDLADGARMVVRRELAGYKPGSPHVYTVTMQRGPGLPQKHFSTPDLDEVLPRLRSLGLPGFDAERANWQPVSSDTSAGSSVWSDEAPTRSLPPMDEPFESEPKRPVDTLPQDIYDPLT